MEGAHFSAQRSQISVMLSSYSIKLTLADEVGEGPPK